MALRLAPRLKHTPKQTVTQEWSRYCQQVQDIRNKRTGVLHRPRVAPTVRSPHPLRWLQRSPRSEAAERARVIRRTATISGGRRESNVQTKGGAKLARIGMFRYRFLAEPSEEMSHLHDEDNESSR